MNSLEATSDGLILCVKAQAGARRNGVLGIHGDALKVAVNQAPEKGKANAAIILLLAEFLSVKPTQISLLSGQTNSRKRFLVHGLSLEQAQLKIAALVSSK